MYENVWMFGPFASNDVRGVFGIFRGIHVGSFVIITRVQWIQTQSWFYRESGKFRLEIRMRDIGR